MTRIITALFFAWFGIAQRDSYDELLKHWAYDQNAALSVKEAGVQDRGGIKIHDISFKAPSGNRAASIGPNGSTVTAYLVVPPGDGPFAAVVYGHWCMPGSAQLNRTEFLEEGGAGAIGCRRAVARPCHRAPRLQPEPDTVEPAAGGRAGPADREHPARDRSAGRAEGCRSETRRIRRT